MRKGKDPDPYMWLTDPDADPGGPKTYDPHPEDCFPFTPLYLKNLVECYKKTPTFLGYRRHLAVLIPE
jgi:hypothetical protein